MSRDFTTAWLMQRELRQAPKQRAPESATTELESELHEAIKAELKRRRWFFCYSRMDKRTTQQLGIPDFVIAAPDGRTFWIEAKRRLGKLTKEQNIARHCLLALGHMHATVYSFQQFIDAIEQRKDDGV